jgi:leucyl aminopeptidase
MDLEIVSGSPAQYRTPCVIAAVYAKRRLSDAAAQLDKAGDGYISRILKRGDLEGRVGQTLLLQQVPGTAAERVLLVGCGTEGELGDHKFREVLVKVALALNETGIAEAVSCLTGVAVGRRTTYWKLRQSIEVTDGALYRFDRLKTKKDGPASVLQALRFHVPARGEGEELQGALREGQAIASGARLARDLANLPGNHCTPTHLAEQAKELERRFASIKVKVLDAAQIKRLGMGAFGAVAQGTREPALLISAEYRGPAITGARSRRERGRSPPPAAPVALVGKGITFDSGGISIKPAAAMDEMKYDMAGAASVLGALHAAAELKLPLNVVGIIPATENMPGGGAIKPGDIVTSLSGQTIEILNTDAEGRLVLCDALSYAERFKPAVVIDIATLTGACVVALGQHASGLLSNHEPLAAALLAAAEESGDRAWQLPLWEEYQKQLDSPFADMANVGGREAGTITAACFLARFTKNYHWAHLDIAGTAWRTTNKKGATGRPVPLLVQYLIDRARAAQGA